MRIGLLIIFLFGMLTLSAQEGPEIITFQSEDYRASGQNWMITQACDGSIYVANSDGILRYNGFAWQLIPFQNQARVRTVITGEDCRVYAGGYRSFGYLEPQGQTFRYQEISAPVIKDRKEEIWHVFRAEGALFFQSFAEVYRFSYDQLALAVPPVNIMYGAAIEEQIIFPKVRGGLLAFSDQGFSSLPMRGNFPAEAKITGICPLSDDRTLIATQSFGLFVLEGEKVQPLDRPIDQLGRVSQVNRLLRLSNGQVAIGTIQDGIYLLDQNLHIEYHINRLTGLTNNTILSLFEDLNHDLWVGTDNGLNLIRLSNPNRYFYDRNDRIGNIFESVDYQGRLFLGSNKGLFARQENGDFTRIPELKGQVWDFLNDQQGNLLVGHNEGTFMYRDGNIQQLSTVTGGLKMLLLPDGQVLQSTFTGWILLQPTQKAWTFAQRIDGTGISFPNYLLQGHRVYGFNSNEGLIRQEFNADFTKVTASVRLRGDAIPANAEPRFFAQKDTVYFCLTADCYQLGEDAYAKIPARATVELQERIKQLRKDSILPFYGGYLRKRVDEPVYLDSVFVDYLLVNGRYQEWSKEPLQLRSLQNNLEIQLANTYHAAFAKNYQYTISRATGPNYWSPLPEEGRIRLQALQAAEYTIMLRSEAGDQRPLLHFEIAPPWYASWPARLSYLLLLASVIYLITTYQSRRSRLVQEKLIREKEKEMERERMLAKNNELEREVNYKSQMLANSTMTLIQKNKMLHELKAYAEDMDKQKNMAKAKSRLLRMINRNLNSDEDWQVFENNFNQIHHAFMARLSNEYEALNQNDLKLAAYIRIGLQSKEIAPLMNISFRSVENKRSHLRKKLQLETGDNLKEFLMHF